MPRKIIRREYHGTAALPRRCEFCGHVYAVPIGISGKSYSDLNRQRQDYLGEFNEDEESTNLGVCCPRCGRFSTKSMRRYFPGGVVHDLAARVLARQAVAGAWIALFLPAIAIVLWTRWMTVSLGLSPGLLEHPPSCNTLDLTMLTAFGIFLPWYFALAAAGVCGISKIPSALMLGLSCLLFLFFAPLGASTFMSGVGSWSVTDPVGLMLLAPAAVLAFFPVLGEHHARIQLARPRRTTVTLGFLVFVATGVIGSVFLLNQYWGGTSETRFYRLLLAAAALTYVGLHHVVICLLMIPAARHCRLVRDFLEREGEGVLREAYAKAKCDLDEAQHGLLRRIIDSYGKYPIWFRPNFIVFIGTPVFISILLWAMKAEPPYQDMARGLLGVTQELAAALETPGQPDISESIRLTVGDTATYAELLRDYLSQDRDDGTRSEHFRRVLGRHVPALAHDLESWNRAFTLMGGDLKSLEPSDARDICALLDSLTLDDVPLDGIPTRQRLDVVRSIAARVSSDGVRLEEPLREDVYKTIGSIRKIVHLRDGQEFLVTQVKTEGGGLQLSCILDGSGEVSVVEVPVESVDQTRSREAPWSASIRNTAQLSWQASPKQWESSAYRCLREIESLNDMPASIKVHLLHETTRTACLGSSFLREAFGEYYRVLQDGKTEYLIGRWLDPRDTDGALIDTGCQETLDRLPDSAAAAQRAAAVRNSSSIPSCFPELAWVAVALRIAGRWTAVGSEFPNDGILLALIATDRTFQLRPAGSVLDGVASIDAPDGCLEGGPLLLCLRKSVTTEPSSNDSPDK